MKTIFDLYKYSINKYSHKLLFRTNNEIFTYKNLETSVNKYKYLMKEYNVKKGDKIIYIGNNSIDWASIHFACYPLGLQFVPIYKNQHKNIIDYIIDETNPKIIFSTQVNNNYVSQIPVIYNNEINKNELKEYIKDDIIPDENESNLILYTSGTTGLSKGVVLTNKNLLSNIQSIDRLIGHNYITNKDHYLSFLPWSHIYGMNCELFYGISKGASFFINENLEHLMNDIKKENPTIICSVPRLLYTIHDKLTSDNSNNLTKLLLSETVIKYSSYFLKRKLFGKNLRMINTGGSAISEDILKFYQKLGIDVFQGYGLSETSPIISLNHSKLNKLGSVGKILDCNEVIIKDDEILVKGTNIFELYYKNKEETEKVFLNGYFMTGDTGYIDKDNYLYITGRKKELYKLDNGKYINPSYIEMILLSSSKIKQIYIYGDNRPYNIALIVPYEDCKLEDIEKDISIFSFNKLKKYEIPKKIILVELFTVENKLLTPKMSMIRNNIYLLHKDKINDMYVK